MKSYNLRRLFVYFLFFIGLLSLSVSVFGVSANQKVWTFTQPDGTKFQAILKGDEFYAYHETVDGYKIIQDSKTGVWYYAILDPHGELIPSSQIVGKSTPIRVDLEKDKVAYLRAVEKIVDEKVAELNKTFGKKSQVPPNGTISGVILLANFSDTSTTYTLSDFTGLLNTVGYNSNGALGSVRDYYLEASYGNLTLNTSVYGWFTLPSTRAYYGANTGGPGTDIRPRDMINDAITAADPTVDFSPFDSDSDGWIDFFGVIHQGQGEEQSGASTDCIWSHRWSLSSPRTVDGIRIQDYHTDPEKYYLTLTTIGVICHESGHFFGIPDLYDTDGTSEGVGEWCIMGSGSWCGPGKNGAKPCHFSAWSKTCLGWVTPTNVYTTQGDVSLPAWDTSPTVLRVHIDPYQDGEYFTITNRYKRSTPSAATGFDEYLPGSGAKIMHIDDYIPTNRIDSRRKVDVEEADGLGHLDSKANRGDAGDVFTAGKTFDNSSNPNSRDNDGISTEIIVTDFQGAGTANMTVDITPKSLSGYCIAYDIFGPSTSGWGFGDFNTDYGAVLFTTGAAGTLDRVKTYFPYSGTTSYTVRIYSSMVGDTPTGLITSETGTSGQGFKEIAITSKPPFGASTNFVVDIAYDTSGGTGWPVPAYDDYTDDDRSYMDEDGIGPYLHLTAALGHPYDLDVNIRADIWTPPAVEDWVIY